MTRAATEFGWLLSMIAPGTFQSTQFGGQQIANSFRHNPVVT
jgi:hypothetical protein